ncbi:MAG: HEPN domain-containing protein [Calothrix sp. MO_192.B10]|nr:HEPN domain-containing protein [Calothrix sp. MO_192.B10]
MKNLDPVDIVDELLCDFASKLGLQLTDDERVVDLISCSGCSGWGLDTYGNLKAELIEPENEKIGFSADFYLDGDPNDDTSILGTSILVKVQGEVAKEDENWEVSEYEVMNVYFYPADEDYLDEEQLDAILSNTEFYQTFLDEISSLQVLNNLSLPDCNVQKTLKRQIYIGAITCLETYLSDAFINTVLSNDKYLRSFFKSFKDFKEQKIGMHQLLEHADNAKEIAKKARLEVIFHNLSKVSNMYKKTLDISFPSFSDIARYISIRHDLVHRNGKTKEGNETPVDDQNVDTVINDIRSFVEQIDKALKEKENFKQIDELDNPFF